LLEYIENQFLQRIYLKNSFVDRKIVLNNLSYSIKGITNVGKTMLVKNYLLTLNLNTYLYIDCADTRLDLHEFSSALATFCSNNSIKTLVLDNYNSEVKLPDVEQVIIISETFYYENTLTKLEVKPLDYEEFLAYKDRFDSSSLTNYFKLGGLPAIQTLPSDIHHTYIQKSLLLSLNTIEFSILTLCSKFYTTKLSVFNIYEKLKKSQKISKDKLYMNFQNLVDKSYIYLLPKFNHPKAINKVYLSDISFQTSLTMQKNFSRVFENSVYNQLRNMYRDIYYYDNIDFYIPEKNTIIFSFAFIDERTFFKKLEDIEAFIFHYRVEKILCITLNNEASLVHPFSQVDMIPFATWALSE